MIACISSSEVSSIKSQRPMPAWYRGPRTTGSQPRLDGDRLRYRSEHTFLDVSADPPTPESFRAPVMTMATLGDPAARECGNGIQGPEERSPMGLVTPESKRVAASGIRGQKSPRSSPPSTASVTPVM
jgi:hypothetical protein